MGKSVYNSVLNFPVRDESGSFYYFLDESGFSTTFVDVVKATVDYINETNSYEMYIIDNNEKKVIKNVKAFSPITNEADIVEAICEADLITTSVCVDNFLVNSTKSSCISNILI